MMIDHDKYSFVDTRFDKSLGEYPLPVADGRIQSRPGDADESS
jgi:hypothetical protein